MAASVFSRSLAQKLNDFNKKELHNKLSKRLIDSLAESCKKTSAECKKIDIESKRFEPKPETLDIVYGYRSK